MQFPPAPQQVSPYTPAGGAAPVAQELQGFGRGNDSMLMHVTPGEVQGLQALAQQYGGSLTTNPQTGLPEAGFLESILPMIAGGLLTMTGVGAPLAAALVGGGTGLLTGDLNKGLMAGLGAFGGAGLAGALGAGASAAGAAGTHAASAATQAALPAAANAGAGAMAHGAAAAGQSAANAAMAGGAAAAAPGAATIAPHAVANMAGGAAPAMSGLGHQANAAMSALGQNAAPALSAPAGALGQNAAMGQASTPGMLSQMLGPKAGAFANKFGDQLAIQGVPRAATTGAGAMGIGIPLLNAMSPQMATLPKDDDFNYEGPYRPTDRGVRFRGPDADMNDSSEFSYFSDTNPYPGFEPAPRGYAQGGPVGDFGPSLLPGQQPYMSPVDMSRAGVPPMLGGPPSSMGSAPSALGNIPTTEAAGMTATDRMLRRPGGDYRPGMGAEHNWNFRPIARPADPTPRGLPSPAEFMAANRGKGLGALMAALKKRTNPVDYGPARSFRFNPMDQSVSEGSGFAAGGVALKDGAFVMDARTVSEMGNGSSSAGQELLARHGGKPIKGPGDGVSDSIPAKLGGGRPARVARDEVKFDPDAVRRIGRGDVRRGAQKLYDLMDKAQHARKVAGRGADTKLRKAL